MFIFLSVVCKTFVCKNTHRLQKVLLYQALKLVASMHGACQSCLVLTLEKQQNCALILGVVRFKTTNIYHSVRKSYLHGR